MKVIYWLLVFFTALQRLWELSHSKANRQSLSSQGFESREEQFSYIQMVALHGSWFIGLIFEPIFFNAHYLGIIPQFCFVFFICAQILRVWTLISLGKHWNTQVMSPAEPCENSFVSHGPYRYIRHPNYLVVIIELFTLPLIAGAYFTSILASIFNATILYRRISLEEKYLFSRPGYSEAMGNKARFLPGIF